VDVAKLRLCRFGALVGKVRNRMPGLPDANCLHLCKAHARLGVNRLETRVTCYSLQGEIDITRIEFDSIAAPTSLLGGEEGCTAAEERVEHDAASI